MSQFGSIGTAWRAEFFLRSAQALPDPLRVVGIGGRELGRAAEVAGRGGVEGCASVDALGNAGGSGWGVSCEACRKSK